jgi:glycine cleavage system H lipoate-binding protein
MLIEVKVPQLPESVTEATLVSWHKAEGEYVQRDENLIDLETDKVVLELPAPQAGVLVKNHQEKRRNGHQQRADCTDRYRSQGWRCGAKNRRSTCRARTSSNTCRST